MSDELIDFEGLPGSDLVRQGLADMRLGIVSQDSLLLLIAAPRLERSGMQLPVLVVARPYEHQLYTLLEEKMGAAAYSYFNSLLRRISSFAACLERNRE